MKTREKLLVYFIMRFFNLLLFSDIKSGYLYNKIFNNLKFEENVYLREILVIGDNVCIGIGALIYLGVKNEGQLDA